MGLHYDHLSDDTRRYMLEEIELDEKNGTSYLSKRLHEAGCERWPTILRDAAASGTDDSLATAIRRDDCLRTHMPRAKRGGGGYTMVAVPVNAPETLAEGEFNRFYIRALCRYALEKGISHLIGYRARYSENPRSSSEAAVGASFDPEALLEDLRSSQGDETQLKMPGGPNSGISLRLP